MKIAYVLEHPVLGGGTKVVFQHAQILHSQGNEVTILARGSRPDWIIFEGNYFDYSTARPTMSRQDLVIATYYSTIAVAQSMKLGPLVHFCQGYEGYLAHLSAHKSAIETAYEQPLPALVVSPYLAQLLKERFGRPAFVVPPPLDPVFRPAFGRFAPRRRRPKIFIPGIFEAEVKDVETALNAVRLLNESGLDCRVIRSSTLPLTEEEQAIVSPSRYLCGVEPKVIAAELRACDLLLFPSLHGEGFGLPLIEAMASKVPVIASDIPSVRFIWNELNVVPQRDVRQFAQGARELLEDANLWRNKRQKGFSAAQKFHPNVIEKQLSEAVKWASELASSLSLQRETSCV